jgi:Rod binding domain-containing protein
MKVSLLSTHAAVEAAKDAAAAMRPASPVAGSDAKVREVFNSFVGQVFFGQLLKSMRKTVGKPAYLHGGRAEEIFQQQLDQILGERLAERSGERFSEPMYALFKLDRR